MKCPSCEQPTGRKVFYAGIPAKLCTEDDCGTIWGPFSFLLLIIPFNGWFLDYTDGNYFGALWHFLKGDFSDMDEEE